MPRSFDEVSATWLGQVLGYDVERADVEPLAPGQAGFLGDVARVTLHYPPSGQRDDPRASSLIVKLPPADPNGRRVGAMLDVWAREQAFYREVSPASPGVAVPRCHHAAGDHDQDRWVFVLEDCPSEPLDAAVGATAAHAEAAVDALVVLHARWWRSDERFGWMPGFDGRGVGGLAPVWQDAIPVFLDRYGHLIPDGTDRWLLAAPTWLPGWSQRAGVEPLTIVHADYRLDNLRYHQGRMTMIDWQTALRGPGAMDLSSFLITACTVADRRRVEASLIDRYADGLRHRGIAVDDAGLARSYDENVLWWMGQFASNLARLEPDDPGAKAALDTMIERTYAAGADRDVGRLLSD